MRVCFVNEYFHPDETGGTGTVLSELCRELADQFGDIEIDILTSRNQYRVESKLAPYEDWDGIHIYRVGSPKPNGLPTPLRMAANLHFSLSALFTLLKKKRYDVVVVATAPPSGAMVGRWYLKLTGVPYVYIVYDLEPDRAVVVNLAKASHPVVRIFSGAQRRWLHSASRVIALGRCMRDYLINTYDLPHDKVDVMATGYMPQTMIPASHDSAFRLKNGIHGFTVLYAGNFGRYHDFDTILDAAAKLKLTNPDVTILLVGDGIQKKHLQQRIAAGLTNVRLFGFVPMEDYADLMATADVALVTLEEGMEGICVPSKIYGILSAGRPVIAVMSPQSEVALIVAENNCGRQVPVGDWQQLASTIADMASRPEHLAEMGRNARQALVTRYSTAAIADSFYGTLTKVVRANSLYRPADAALQSTRKGRSGADRHIPEAIKDVTV
jgi:glycosyltransferase involved in cell wall biosynthesis